MDQYIEDMQLLSRYQIGTAEELFAVREELDQKISDLEAERTHIYNKVRRAKEPEKTELKEQAKEVTKKITPLRNERKCTFRIWERSLERVKTLLDQERQLEEQAMNRYNERSYTR